MPAKKSARYQYNWELPDQFTLKNPAIPGGKKSKSKKGAGFFDDVGNVLTKVAKTAVAVAPAVAAVAPLAAKALGGKRMGNAPEMVPLPHQVEISGGLKINDGRGNIKEIEEATKPVTGGKKKRGRPSKKGAGIFGDIGNIADAVTDVVGLGKNKKRGRPSKKGAGIFGDIGNLADAVTDVVGLGKNKKPGRPSKKAAAGIFGDIGNLADTVVEGLGKKKGGAAGDSFIGVKSGVGKKIKGGISSGALPLTTTNPLEAPLIGSSKRLPKKEQQKAVKEQLNRSVQELEAGLKFIKKNIKKMK